MTHATGIHRSSPRPPALRLAAACAIALAVLLGAARGEELDYPELVRRMWDLEALAALPPAGESEAQTSSHDRNSRYEESTGRYRNWYVNSDIGGYVRKEGEDTVLAEMQGPGCIWRIWSARAEQGSVRIYLDGNPEPVVDMPFAHYFDGKHAPFDRPELHYVAARGLNFLTPIPYQKSCKIVAAPGWGGFYHVNHTTFPPGTKVPTFRRELSPADAAALDDVNRRFARRGERPAPAEPGEETLTRTVKIGAGETVRVATLDGARAITALRARLANMPAAPANQRLLRELCLKITWDDAPAPAVWSPFGDFFASGAGRPLQSLTAGLKPDGEWYAYWYMPFARRAVVELNNDGATPQELSFEISHASLRRPAEAYARFHAKWHRNRPPSDDLDRTLDWELVRTRGAGRFVGLMLHIWNPVGGWWGEGDEKFFVDGERFPSTFGTGSEDYFGYAWCSPARFDRALHGQSHAEGNNAGHTENHRWQIADNIPFHGSFDGFMEKYFSDRRPTLYAATVYWYLNDKGRDPYGELPVSERVGYWEHPPALFGSSPVMTADLLPLTARIGGRWGLRVTPEYERDWLTDAGREVCLWTELKPGHMMDLKISWTGRKPGRHRIFVRFIKSPAGATVQAHWNKLPVGEPIDLHAPKPVVEEVLLAELDCVENAQSLRLIVTPSARTATPSPGVGIESIRIEPASAPTP